MADLTIYTLAEAGVDAAANFVACAAGGDKVKVRKGGVFLHAKNTNAAVRNITLTAVKTSFAKEGFGTVTRGNIVVQVPATTGERILGPIPPGAFGDANGDCAITYDAVTNLTIKAYECPQV